MDSLNRLSPIAQKVTQASYIYPYANKKERYALPEVRNGQQQKTVSILTTANT